jgi:hypothetical protein
MIKLGQNQNILWIYMSLNVFHLRSILQITFNSLIFQKNNRSIIFYQPYWSHTVDHQLWLLMSIVRSHHEWRNGRQSAALSHEGGGGPRRQITRLLHDVFWQVSQRRNDSTDSPRSKILPCMKLPQTFDDNSHSIVLGAWSSKKNAQLETHCLSRMPGV